MTRRWRFGALIGALSLIAASAMAQQEAPRRWLKYVMPTVAADDSLVFVIADAPNLATPGSPNPDNLDAVRLDGSDLRRLTHNGASHPRWFGPKDGFITFAGTANDTGNVFGMRPNGSGLRLVSAVNGRFPVLSPDASKVAFVVGPAQMAEIWVADLKASTARWVAGGRGIKALDPSWDPEGRRLAYTFGEPSSGLGIHVVRVEGAVRDSAVTDPLDRLTSYQRPVWSPDGKRIVFQWSTESERGSRIGIIDLPTRRMNILRVPPPKGRDVAHDEWPSWFPDSRRIAFSSDRSGNSDIWFMNDDGTDLRQITGIRPR